jgi:hypothetical protein
LHAFDPAQAADRALEERMNALQVQLAGGSPPCHA